MPDVPELHACMLKTINDLKKAISPILIKINPHITLNALVALLLDYSTFTCESQEEVNDVVDCMCKALKENSENTYAIRNEINNKEF